MYGIFCSSAFLIFLPNPSALSSTSTRKFRRLRFLQLYERIVKNLSETGRILICTGASQSGNAPRNALLKSYKFFHCVLGQARDEYKLRSLLFRLYRYSKPKSSRNREIHPRLVAIVNWRPMELQTCTSTFGP